MKKTKNSLTGVLLPYSMEPKSEYILRVNRNPDMRELFPNPIERIKLALEAFQLKWDEALVTVTKADGTQFFID